MIIVNTIITADTVCVSHSLAIVSCCTEVGDRKRELKVKRKTSELSYKVIFIVKIPVRNFSCSPSWPLELSNSRVSNSPCNISGSINSPPELIQKSRIVGITEVSVEIPEHLGSWNVNKKCNLLYFMNRMWCVYLCSGDWRWDNVGLNSKYSASWKNSKCFDAQ